MNNEDLFQWTSEYYKEFRKGYPIEFFNYIKHKFHSEWNEKLLDLGCGTGQLAIPLSIVFKEVVAMDASGEMIEVAKKVSKNLDIENIVWLKSTAEQLGEIKNKIGKVNMVTIGNAFHHMDHESTLSYLEEIVRPDWTICIVYSGESLRNQNTIWKKVVHEVINKYLGKFERTRESLNKKKDINLEEILMSSSFKKIQKYEHTYNLDWNIKNIIGHLYTTSYCSLEKLGEKKELFERELKEKLLDISPIDNFKEEVTLFAYFAKNYE